VSPILESIGSVKGFGWGALLSSTSYESIATTTVGAGGSSSVTFSSIPSTYTHLQLRFLCRDSNAAVTDDGVTMQFNGDTAANYNRHSVYGDGATAASSGHGSPFTYVSAGLSASGGQASGVFAPGVLDILDYKNTNKYKTTRRLAGLDVNGAGGVIQLASGSWRSTSAITSITLKVVDGSYNFAQYSSIALYGIKGA
jgi:hypothetical protein